MQILVFPIPAKNPLRAPTASRENHLVRQDASDLAAPYAFSFLSHPTLYLHPLYSVLRVGHSNWMEVSRAPRFLTLTSLHSHMLLFLGLLPPPQTSIYTCLGLLISQHSAQIRLDVHAIYSYRTSNLLPAKALITMFICLSPQEAIGLLP